MRIDEWQKWLDSQFLDQRAQDDEGAPETGAPVVTGVLPAPSAAPVELPKPRPPASVVVLPPPNAKVRSSPLAATDSARPSGDAEQFDELPMPAIEEYFPFLRRTSEPEFPPPQTDEPKPDEPADAPREPTEAGGVAAEQAEARSELAQAPTHDERIPETEPSGPVAVRAAGLTPEDPIVAGATETPERGTDAPESREAERTAADAAAGASRTRRPRKPQGSPRVSHESAEPLTPEAFWDLTPRRLHALLAVEDGDKVAQNYYKRQFRETRMAFIQRLLDPTLSLEDAARLLNVCPTTVRRHTNRGTLSHLRTAGDQRRFRLSDVLAFLEKQSRDAGPDAQGTAER